MRTLLLAAGILLGASPALPANPKPSFDCAKARTTVERAICADGELARLDAALAVAYRAARRRLEGHPGPLAALKDEHKAFLEGRDDAMTWPGASLRPYLASWTRWLEAVAPPPAGWEGAWINGSGSVVVAAPRGEGGFSVRANGDAPITGRYTCEFDGIGRVENGALVVSWDTTDGGEDGGEGWTLVLRREGGLLALEQARNASEVERAPFCGTHGSLDGTYVPASVRPEPLRAWR